MDRTARILALLDSGSDSARACAATAIDCLARIGQPCPRHDGWGGAADAWIERGAQHAWGFARPWA